MEVDQPILERPRRRLCASVHPGHAAGALIGLVVTLKIAMSTFAVAPRIEDAPPCDVQAARHSIQNRTAIYLGRGCFWELQRILYSVERRWGRDPFATTATTGYAGGTSDAGDTVCYHGSSAATDYGSLGHAEAVRVQLDGGASSASAVAQTLDLVTAFFGSFRPARWPSAGWERPDQRQDVGAEYRSVIGLPGGLNSPLWPAVVRANKQYGMALRAAAGSDDDEFNTVWVYDTGCYPFFRAERYHQYHSDYRGMPYPPEYVDDLWGAKSAAGKIAPVPGCVEGQHW